MKLKYPTSFRVNYPEKNRKYYNVYSQSIIKAELTTASLGYCMYCGNSLLNNGKNDGQIEHSIEKVQNGQVVEYLKHCKYNLSIACKTCNTSFKKNVRGIKISTDLKCPKTCNSMCYTYINNMNEYLDNNQIILMPKGVIDKKTGNNLNIQYNLFTMSFEPSSEIAYTTNELRFIWSHIDRFKLNSEEYMPLDILRVCEHIVKYNDIPNEGNFKNIIADIFIKYLKNEVTFDNMQKLSKLIIIMNSL